MLVYRNTTELQNFPYYFVYRNATLFSNLPGTYRVLISETGTRLPPHRGAKLLSARNVPPHDNTNDRHSCLDIYFHWTMYLVLKTCYTRARILYICIEFNA